VGGKRGLFQAEMVQVRIHLRQFGAK
jgi:hypothetical protein